MLKFRKLGGFQEEIPIESKRKVNMKKKEEPIVRMGPTGKFSQLDLKDEVGRIKQQISKDEESSAEPRGLVFDEVMKKLKLEVDEEFAEAIKAVGLKDRLDKLYQEFVNVKTSQDHLMHPSLMDKIEKLGAEFKKSLANAPNYDMLNYKLDMFKEISKHKELSSKNDKAKALKQEINTRFQEVLERSDVMEKIKMLEAEVANAGVSTLDDLDYELKKKISKVKQEIYAELANVLRSSGLDVAIVKSKAKDDVNDQTSLSSIRSKVEELNTEINKGIEKAINSSDLKNKIEFLKLDVLKAGRTPGTKLTNKIEALKQQIKQKLTDGATSALLLNQYEQAKAEIVKLAES